MAWLGSVTFSQEEMRWTARLKVLVSGIFRGETAPEHVQVLSWSTQELCSAHVWDQAADLHPTAKGTAGGCSPGCVRALQLPWEHCEILHRDKYLVIWGLDGKMAVPATRCPRPLNCYRRRVIIERGRCFLINYVNPAAAQPSCIFSNIISFVAQLLSVLWATVNLKKL